MDYLDILNKQFGKLTVLKFLRQEPYKRRNNYWYLCKCECGKQFEQHRANLVTHHTQSCGCLKRKSQKHHHAWTGFGDLSGRHWKSILSHASNRNLQVTITIEDAWLQYTKQKGKCALSGIPITLRSTCRDYTERSASLDRIDNTQGYVLNNIQWLHKDINWMKGRFDTNQFIDLCKSVASFSKQGKRNAPRNKCF